MTEYQKAQMSALITKCIDNANDDLVNVQKRLLILNSMLAEVNGSTVNTVKESTSSKDDETVYEARDIILFEDPFIKLTTHRKHKWVEFANKLTHTLIHDDKIDLKRIEITSAIQERDLCFKVISDTTNELFEMVDNYNGCESCYFNKNKDCRIKHACTFLGAIYSPDYCKYSLKVATDGKPHFVLTIDGKV